MPDGNSDNAVDFYASSFCKDVIDVAHPTRFSKERITYGSDVFTQFRGDIWQENTNDEIAKDEWKLAGTRRVPLARLDDGSRTYGRLLDNMLRPFGRRECKDHFLTTYPDDRPVGFTILDFDRHPPRARKEPLSVESDEWLDIDEMFWEQVTKFHKLATRLNLDVMWVQSPGRWLTSGHHIPCRMFGLYAIIRHEPRTPSQLRPMLAAFKERIGLDVETSWDTRHRNIRIPGQCFMDVCRVDPTRRSIVPIRDAGASGERERNMDRLAATVDGYEGLRPESGERLLGVGTRLHSVQVEGGARLLGVGARPIGIHRKGGTPPEAGGEPEASPSGDGESSAAGSDDVGQRFAASPCQSTAVAKKRGSGSARNHHTASDNTDPARWPRETDTFKVLHGSGLLYRVLREFGWEASSVDEAVAWAAPQFRNLRPASSATCSDQNTLTAFLTKHYLWGCETYDAAKAMGNARCRARIADEARIAPSLRLDDRALDVYLRNVACLTEAELSSLRRYRVLERRYAGRISCCTLYAVFGNQRRYMTFTARHRLLHIAQEHSQSQGRCRQWSLSPRAVRSVRTLMASPVLLFMLRGERGVTYTNTRQRNPRHKQRISPVGLTQEARGAPELVTSALAARGPPPEASKTRENAMFGKPGSAIGARRRGAHADAA